MEKWRRKQKNKNGKSKNFCVYVYWILQLRQQPTLYFYVRFVVDASHFSRFFNILLFFFFFFFLVLLLYNSSIGNGIVPYITLYCWYDTQSFHMSILYLQSKPNPVDESVCMCKFYKCVFYNIIIECSSSFRAYVARFTLVIMRLKREEKKKIWSVHYE